LTDAERLQLRKERFKFGSKGGEDGPKTTIEALAAVEEHKRKILERAQRFGI